ncbi:MAG TPA: IclR family transcriptional regulator [Aldersonia sp.]
MKPRPISKPAYMIESVHKALCLLNAIRDHGSLRLKEAAEEIDVAESTAHRILAMLIYHGFVVQEEDSRRYFPGPSMGVGPTSSGWTREFRDACIGEMRALSTTTGETVNLVVRTATTARVIGAVESTKLVRVGNRQGHVPAARHSGGGKALLAELDDDELRQLYLSPQSADPMTVDEFDRLTAELRAIRRTGYAKAVDEVEEGLSAVGVAMRNSRHVALGAVVVALPTARLAASLDAGLVARMRAAVARIEEQVAAMEPTDVQ